MGRRTRRGRRAVRSADPGAGAAGGIGAALLALGARRESGAAVIAEHTHLADDFAAADLVITGEGRFDDQSLHGKVVSALAAAARLAANPVLVLAGQVGLDETRCARRASAPPSRSPSTPVRFDWRSPTPPTSCEAWPPRWRRDSGIAPRQGTVDEWLAEGVSTAAWDLQGEQ